VFSVAKIGRVSSTRLAGFFSRHRPPLIVSFSIVVEYDSSNAISWGHPARDSSRLLEASPVLARSNLQMDDFRDGNGGLLSVANLLVCRARYLFFLFAGSPALPI
jgi:hypothetical protein